MLRLKVRAIDLTEAAMHRVDDVACPCQTKASIAS
jgi:hypothetical protein